MSSLATVFDKSEPNMVSPEKDTTASVVESLEAELHEVTKERDELKSKLESTSHEILMLEDVTRQMEFFETERNKLAQENRMYKEQNVENQKERNKLAEENRNYRLQHLENQQEIAYFRQAESDTELTMTELRISIEALEHENARLLEEADSQQRAMEEVQRQGRFRRFDASIEEKATDSKVEELQARLEDIKAENSRLVDMSEEKDQAIAKLESEKSILEYKVTRFQTMNARLEDSKQSLENTVSAVTNETTVLRQNLAAVEDEKKELLLKCESKDEVGQQQQDHLTPLKTPVKASAKQSRLQNMLSQSSIQNLQSNVRNLNLNNLKRIGGLQDQSKGEMAARLAELEDEHQRWFTKCNNQQLKLSMLEDELEKVTAESISKDSKIAILKTSISDQPSSKTNASTIPLTDDMDKDDLLSKIQLLEGRLRKSEEECQTHRQTVQKLENLRSSASSRSLLTNPAETPHLVSI